MQAFGFKGFIVFFGGADFRHLGAVGFRGQQGLGFKGFRVWDLRFGPQDSEAKEVWGLKPQSASCVEGCRV